MSEIYRRYNPTQHPNSQHSSPQHSSPQHSNMSGAPASPQPSNHTHRKTPVEQHTTTNAEKNLLLDFLPANLYNPRTKKILGFFSAEDLLLVALIFLFLEDSKEDNPLLALALVYVLLSDYINTDFLGFQ